GGVGNGNLEVGIGRDQGLDQAGFTCAGWRRNNVEGTQGFHIDGDSSGFLIGSSLRAGLHSMFWICSRICSISTLSSTAQRVVSVTIDLDDRVFASRFNSCIRKSSR